MRYLFLFFLILSFRISAAPFWGEIKSFTQPDGSRVDVKLFGTELYMRAEGLDGYTLIRDPKTRWICYATLNSDKSVLISTGRIYAGQRGKPGTLKKWDDLPLRMDISEKEKEKAIQSRAMSISGGDPFHLLHTPSVQGTPVFPVNGQIKGLCILIDFSDEPSTLPVSEYASFCNDLNYSNFGNNGSLRTYFRDMSKGLVDYTNVVAGFFRAPKTFAHYDSLPFAAGAQEILIWALQKMDSAGFDFSTLSLNPANNSIMAINLMYTGEPPDWAQGMWFHKGYLNGFTSTSGILSGDYNCSPAAEPLGIGVVAHENGHMICKWPDTYKYNQNTGPDGIGAFDLMCWYGNNQNPVPPNPLFRLNAGWGKNLDISNMNGLVTDTANFGNVRSFRNDNDTNEFYLIEAREQEGRSAFIPDRGLTVWRINRLGNNQTLNHEVALIPAGNNVNNLTTACFRAGFRTSFHHSTVPSSAWRNADPSGLRLTNISSPGTTMIYNAGQTGNAAFLKLIYRGISYDDNSNGMVEPGETIRVRFSIKNTGTGPSGSVAATATGISPFSNYYSFTNPNQSFPALSPNQEIPLEFQFQMIPAAQTGKQITMRFQITANGNSIFVTRQFIVGPFLNMISGIDSLCNSVFYDPGGINTYPDNTYITQTLFPKNQASAIKANFLWFNLEDSPSCQYDYLQIFDGPSVNAPLLGTFCGDNSPGIVVSSHPSGALTLCFRSDEGLAGDGWEANISCVPFSSVESAALFETWMPWPNPAEREIFLPPSATPLKVDLLDSKGRICLSMNTEAGSGGKISTEVLPDGLYLLRVVSESAQKTMKWIIRN